MSDDLGVCLARERRSPAPRVRGEASAWFSITPLWTTATLAAVTAPEVRVGVAVAGRPVGGPAGVADPTGPRRRLALERLLQVPDPARRLAYDQPAAVERRDPRAVVSAILKPAKPGDQDRAGLVRPGVSHDSAHRFASSLARFAATTGESGGRFDHQTPISTMSLDPSSVRPDAVARHRTIMEDVGWSRRPRPAISSAIGTISRRSVSTETSDQGLNWR